MDNTKTFAKNLQPGDVVRAEGHIFTVADTHPVGTGNTHVDSTDGREFFFLNYRNVEVIL